MSDELVITAIGPDRPGLTAQFSGLVHAAGVNLADSRMVNLRGQFAMLVLAIAETDKLTALKANLREQAPKLGLSVEFSKAPKSAPGKGVPFRLKTYSMDQPGIVHKVTTWLHGHAINIEELETRLESAPFMGTPIFTMEVLMLVPPGVSVTKLRRELEELGESINCDVDIDPA